MDGAIVQVNGDQIVYRASAIGTPCLQQLIAARMEYDALPTPVKILETFNKGDATEERVLSQLRKANPKEWTTSDRQKEIRVQITKTISVVGHADAVRVPSWRILEIKSQSDDEYRKGFEGSKFYDRYLWQISCYMHGTGWPLDVLCVRRDEDEAAELEWNVVSFEEPPIGLGDIRRKILRAEAAAKEDKLPGCEEVVYPCPYFYLHAEIQEFESRILVQPEDLIVLAKQYKDDGVREKVIKERRDKVKAAIDQAIEGDDAVVADPDGGGFYKVHFYDGSRSGITAAGQKQMKDDGIDPEKYKSTSSFRGLRVTLPE